MIARLWSILRRPWTWVGGHSPLVILALLAAVGGLWAFLEVVDVVLDGASQTFDERVVLAMRDPNDLATPIGPPWLAELGRDLTALGGVAVLTLVTIGVGGFLFIRRQRRAGLLVIAATLSGLVISTLLKQTFARERPTLVPHLSHVGDGSFPSGHSMLSAVVYLTLGGLLTRFVSRDSLKAYLLGVAVLLTLLVGVSRVYMGVHYPTDVLAGWSAGLTWAMLCLLVAARLQGRGRVERHDQRDAPGSFAVDPTIPLSTDD